jgi:hypothetical protein
VLGTALAPVLLLAVGCGLARGRPAEPDTPADGGDVLVSGGDQDDAARAGDSAPTDEEVEAEDCVMPTACDPRQKQDVNGTLYCECYDPTCVPHETSAERYENPLTGACVQFADSCEVPSQWPPCTEGCPAGDDCEKPCDYDGQTYAPGEQFTGDDGCSHCRCIPGGTVSCWDGPCVDDCTTLGQSECDALTSCTWLDIVPACGDGPADLSSGCFPSVECTPPRSCDAGMTCVGVAAQSRCTAADCAGQCAPNYDICQPTDVVCGDAALDGGVCRSSDGVERPAVCCLAEVRSSCEETGGLWFPTTCGHWSCGQPNSCSDRIGGCNCGLGSSFVDGVGCQTDASCPVLANGCDYDGAHYQIGETFPATDGCNTCVCMESGDAACTSDPC